MDLFTNASYQHLTDPDRRAAIRLAIKSIERGLRYGPDMPGSLASCVDDAVRILQATLDSNGRRMNGLAAHVPEVTA